MAVVCAHCDREFGVEFIKGEADPIYFELAESVTKDETIFTLADIMEMKKEYDNMFFRDVVVCCHICGGANVVEVPYELLPKRTESRYLGVPGKPKDVV
jgi:hypothetical protein